MIKESNNNIILPLNLITSGESPNGNYRISKLDGAVLKLCTRKSKKVRREDIL